MPYSNPEEAAAKVRRDAWNGTIPVDPVRIAYVLGIKVVQSRLGSDTSGALMKHVGQDPIIVLNDTDHPNRQRFTCAHELGHFVHRGEMPDEYSYVDFRDWRSSTGTSAEERFANGFAAALLMPKDDVKKLWKQGQRDLQLAVRFDVSREAMQNRLKNLGLM